MPPLCFGWLSTWCSAHYQHRSTIFTFLPFIGVLVSSSKRFVLPFIDLFCISSSSFQNFLFFVLASTAHHNLEQFLNFDHLKFFYSFQLHVIFLFPEQLKINNLKHLEWFLWVFESTFDPMVRLQNLSTKSDQEQWARNEATYTVFCASVHLYARLARSEVWLWHTIMCPCIAFVLELPWKVPLESSISPYFCQQDTKSWLYQRCKQDREHSEFWIIEVYFCPEALAEMLFEVQNFLQWLMFLEYYIFKGLVTLAFYDKGGMWIWHTVRALYFVHHFLTLGNVLENHFGLGCCHSLWQSYFLETKSTLVH